MPCDIHHGLAIHVVYEDGEACGCQVENNMAWSSMIFMLMDMESVVDAKWNSTLPFIHLMYEDED